MHERGIASAQSKGRSDAHCGSDPPLDPVSEPATGVALRTRHWDPSHWDPSRFLGIQFRVRVGHMGRQRLGAYVLCGRRAVSRSRRSVSILYIRIVVYTVYAEYHDNKLPTHTCPSNGHHTHLFKPREAYIVHPRCRTYRRAVAGAAQTLGGVRRREARCDL